MPIFVRYFEILFELVYLFTAVILGMKILKTAKDNQHKLFGYMALILGGGDAFHLVPRMIANATNSFSQYASYLGYGQMITSVTMTIFYVFLYRIYKIRYNKNDTKAIDWTVFLLAAIRIILVALPNNKWALLNSPYIWGIYRNIPFLILGLIIIVLFIKQTRNTREDPYYFMGLAVLLSFALYLPVVLGARFYPILGIFMMPKTLAYVWIIFMGFNDNKKAISQ